MVVPRVIVVVVCVVQMMIVWNLNYQPFGSSGFLRYQKDLLAGFMQQAMQHMKLVLVPPTQKIAPSTTGGAARNINSGLE